MSEQVSMPEPSLDLLKRVATRMRETAPDTSYIAEWAADEIERLTAERDEIRKKLIDYLECQPAQMGSSMGMLPINSEGMRRLVDALDAAISERDLYKGQAEINQRTIKEMAEAKREPKAQRCAATLGFDPPQDCDAPFCGCNPEWPKVIEMLQECGWKSPAELRAAHEPAAARNRSWCGHCGQETTPASSQTKSGDV